MKKRNLILAISLGCAVLGVLGTVAGILVGVGGKDPAPQPTPTTEATEQTQPPRIREDMGVFISLPDENDSHWASAGEDLTLLFENLGYAVTLTYAQNDALEQANQMTQAVETDVDCIIVAPVDSAVLYEATQLAKQAQIPIVAYDRLLMDTDAVNYCVSYDYRAMGLAIGTTIAKNKELALASAEQSYTVEFFMGSPENSNALLLYRGVMEALQPYLDSGVLVSKTGRTAFEDTCVVDWSPQSAADSLKSYLKEYYKDGYPDILCTVSDSLADACITVLKEAGCPQEEWPVITGMGGTKVGLEHLHEGLQLPTIGTDLMALNERCVRLTDDVLMGKLPEVNDTGSCHNNVKPVPAYLCGFQTVLVADSLGQTEDVPEDTTAATGETQPATAQPTQIQ